MNDVILVDKANSIQNRILKNKVGLSSFQNFEGWYNARFSIVGHIVNN